MNPSHQKILEALGQCSLSLQQLADDTHLSKDGIRGRISELRKTGYNIQNINGKYHLNQISNAQKIIDYMEKHDICNITLSIQYLSSQLNITAGEVEDGLAELFHRKNITIFQASPTTIRITLQ